MFAYVFAFVEICAVHVTFKRSSKRCNVASN